MDRAAAPLETEADRLLACIHCGFCIDACPTYTRGGNESDSPRGRIYLMRGVAEGRIPADSDAFRRHIDRCLGCRACEPVCPSGVEYGYLLERGREVIANARGISFLERTLLRTFGSPVLNGMVGFVARVLRATRLAALGARLMPARLRRLRTALAMLESSRRWKPATHQSAAGEETAARADSVLSADRSTSPDAIMIAPGSGGSRVAVFEGCVQKTLFGRVNAATAAVMRHNGHTITKVSGQRCCGALHAHAGALEEARALALRNMEAFEPLVTGPDAVAAIIVNAAGCGAMMSGYGALFEGRPEQGLAEAVGQRIRDPLVFLAERGVRAGSRLEMRAAWDSPCHLLHGQRSGDAPRDALRAAVPGLEVVPVRRSDECCGGAGIHALVHGGYSDRVLADKLAAVRSVDPDVVVTANPGCMMQIGGGLVLAGESVRAAHPIELIARSYG